MDTLNRQERSERMSRVKSRDTKPEMAVRRLVHAMGYRYRLSSKHLPGKPDLVFGPRRKVIFVHGCFWHRHPDPDCKLARLPKSRKDFWIPKLERNRERDLETLDRLKQLGWQSLVIWECEVRDADHIRGRIKRFLSPES